MYLEVLKNLYVWLYVVSFTTFGKVNAFCCVLLATLCTSDLETVIKNIYLKFWIEVWVTVGCTNLHNEELHNLYSSPNIIKIIKTEIAMQEI
jgi:hypothetical protein